MGTLEQAPGAPSAGPGFWWRVLSPPGAVLAAFAALVAAAGVLSLAPLGDDALGAILAFGTSALLLAFGLVLWRALPEHDRRLAVARPIALRPTVAAGIGVGFLLLIVALVIVAADHETGSLAITPDFLLELHETTTRGLGVEGSEHFAPRHEGTWRDGMAVVRDRITGTVFHTAPPPDEVEPRMKGLIPPIAVATAPVAYVRFHGRNAQKWWRHDEAHERYEYEYKPEELQEWVPKIKKLDQEAEHTFVFTNNHYKGGAVRTANQIKEMLA